ncbi:intraflagellar transport protein 25 homolog [Polyodon spathula]|uniref:intraflagellar transport protein 25 homolog n=1 Tax=Polyodon spathula TaxID=7913 RepID=UPI001B7E61C5|nr:intraflagellar transport protein 25 homolog [Polyodon spathula]
MIDAALSSSGAQVVLATSSDENYLPENIIDGRTETFWISTGMFPQEFIIRFSNLVKVSVVTIQCYNVQKLSIEKSVSTDAADFEKVIEKDFEHTEGQLQSEDFSFNGTRATHLRFVVKSGFDHFVSVHRVMVEGTIENHM